MLVRTMFHVIIYIGTSHITIPISQYSINHNLTEWRTLINVQLIQRNNDAHWGNRKGLNQQLRVLT